MKSKKGPVCFYCGESGHVKRFCKEWKKKQEEEEVGNKKEKEESTFSVKTKERQGNIVMIQMMILIVLFLSVE